MKAYRTYLTIGDAKQVVLADLPFEPGERVEVLVLAQEVDRAEALGRLEALLRETQALPQLESLTEDDIAEEIAARRRA